MGEMVDITSKPVVYREAVAEGEIVLKPETINRIKKGSIEKGNVLETAKIAAILAVKQTPLILPLTHPIRITGVQAQVQVVGETRVRARVTVKTLERTGVEMEALTGVTTALLTVWDMVKKYEKDEHGNYPTTIITNIRVLSKKKEEASQHEG